MGFKRDRSSKFKISPTVSPGDIFTNQCRCSGASRKKFLSVPIESQLTAALYSDLNQQDRENMCGVSQPGLGATKLCFGHSKLHHPAVNSFRK